MIDRAQPSIEQLVADAQDAIARASGGSFCTFQTCAAIGELPVDGDPAQLRAYLDAETHADHRAWLRASRLLLHLLVRHRSDAKRECLAELSRTPRWQRVIGGAISQLGRPIDLADGYWPSEIDRFERVHDRALPVPLREYLLLLGRRFDLTVNRDHWTSLYNPSSTMLGDDLFVFLVESQGAYGRAVRWGAAAATRVVLLEQEDEPTGAPSRAIPGVDPLEWTVALEGPDLHEWLSARFEPDDAPPDDDGWAVDV